MKSLKRTLSLVLALVMVLGLFGGISMTAAATDFTDDETIQYKEAVDVVTGIGAINGYKENGEFVFKPGDNITRAEAAKMVAYTAITAQAGELLTGVTSSFSDVDATKFKWAIPSIEYLVKEGAINGVGGGKFEPNEDITGYQVLKMLLCVLGYGKKSEYVGTGWDLQVAIDAANNKLTASLAKGTKLDAPATREQLALYCYNALGAEVVSLSPLTNEYVKNNLAGNSPYNGKPNETLADKIYDLDVAYGVITANQATDDDNAKSNTTSIRTMTNFTSAPAAAAEFDAETGIDLIGHYVKVYYRPGTGSGTSGDAKNPYVTCTIVDESTVVTVADVTGLDASTGDSAADNAALEKIKATFGYAPSALANNLGANSFKFDNTYAATTSAAIAGDEIVLTGSSEEVADPGIFILAGTEIVSFIALPSYSADIVSEVKDPTASSQGKIDFANISDITVPSTNDTTSGTATNYANYRIYDGIAKDDVVYQVQTGPFYTIAKADSVDIKVKAVNTTAAGKEVITDTEGNDYTLSTTSATLLADNDPFAAFGDGLVNKECKLYTGPDGTVIAIVPTTKVEESSVLYVVDSYTKQVTNSYGQPSGHLVYVQAVDLVEGKEVNLVVGYVSDATNSATSLLTTEGIGILYDKGANSGTTTELTTAKYYENKFVKVTKTTASAIAQTDVVDLKEMEDGSNDLSIAIDYATDDIAPSTVAIGSGKTHYLTADTKYVYIMEATGTTWPTNDTIGTLKITTATGGQTIDADTYKNGDGYAYYATATEAGGSNANVNYVVLLGKPAASAASSLMFVPNAFTGAKSVSYTKEDGTEAKAYSNVAFIDGKIVEVLMKDNPEGNYPVGFYKYSVSDSLYTLTGTSDGVGIGVVTNVKDNYITVMNKATGGSVVEGIENKDAGSAFITDVPYETAVASKATTLPDQHSSLSSLKGNSVAFTYKTDGSTITVTGLYYLGAPQSVAPVIKTASVKIGDGAAIDLNDSQLTTLKTGKVELTATGAVSNAVKGKAITLTLTFEDASSRATYTYTVAKTNGTITFESNSNVIDTGAANGDKVLITPTLTAEDGSTSGTCGTIEITINN